MSLYKLRTEEENVNIYSRERKDIIDLVTFYQQQAISADNSLLLAHWVRKTSTLEEIDEVKNGILYFQDGPIYFNKEIDKESFFRKLNVTPDFAVYVNDESFLAFEIFRRMLPQMKRKNLYKVQTGGRGVFASLNFIPQDVAHAIRNYDLTSHLEHSRIKILSMKRKIGNHPNLNI